MDASKFEEGGHAVWETADYEPVKSRRITHLQKNISKQCCNSSKKVKKCRKTGRMWHLRKNIAKQCCNNFQKGKKCRKTPSVSTLGSSVRLCREMVERVSTAVIPATLVDWETEFTVDHDAFCLTAILHVKQMSHVNKTNISGVSYIIHLTPTTTTIYNLWCHFQL